MISIVVPVYNEKNNIENLYEQVSAVFENEGLDWELILVDDGSRDGSFDLIKSIYTTDSRVKGLKFSRNFGQYAAVTAGIESASGDAVIIMDADLQEPPSLIPKLVQKWKEGYMAVYTTATKRADSLLRRIAGSLFYKIFGNASFLGNVQNISEMRLVDKKVAQAFCSLKERPRFIKGLFFWLGYKHVIVEYEKQKRAAGESKYSWSRLAKLAMDGIFSFSFFPVKLITYAGGITFLLGAAYGVKLLASLILRGSWLDISQVILFTLLFGGGIQLLSMGVLGEYISRIYDEARQRPKYIVEEKLVK